MQDMKWGVSSTDTQLTAFTGLDSKADKSTSFLFDIVNDTPRNLNLELWVEFGTMTLSAGASGRFVARRKRGGVYADNNNEVAPVEFPSGANITPRINVQMRIPNGRTYGIYFISNLGTNTPASGNSLNWSTWNEASE